LRNSQSLLSGSMDKPEIVAKYRYGNYKGFLLGESKGESAPMPSDTGRSLASVEEEYGFYGSRATVDGKTLVWQDYQNGRYLPLYEGELNYLF